MLSERRYCGAGCGLIRRCGRLRCLPALGGAAGCEMAYCVAVHEEDVVPGTAKRGVLPVAFTAHVRLQYRAWRVTRPDVRQRGCRNTLLWQWGGVGRSIIPSPSCCRSAILQWHWRLHCRALLMCGWSSCQSLWCRGGICCCPPAGAALSQTPTRLRYLSLDTNVAVRCRRCCVCPRVQCRRNSQLRQCTHRFALMCTSTGSVCFCACSDTRILSFPEETPS